MADLEKGLREMIFPTKLREEGEGSSCVGSIRLGVESSEHWSALVWAMRWFISWFRGSMSGKGGNGKKGGGQRVAEMEEEKQGARR